MKTFGILGLALMGLSCSTEQSATKKVEIYPRYMCEAEFKCQGELVGKVTADKSFLSKKECTEHLLAQVSEVKACKGEEITEANLVGLEHTKVNADEIGADVASESKVEKEIPKRAEYENFFDVTGLNGLVPYNKNIPEKSWKYIFQEKESGMLVTNYLGDRNFEDANLLCEGLNGGTARHGWTLPTKEQLEFLAGKKEARVKELGKLYKWFWSSVSDSTTHAWLVHLANGFTYLSYKPVTRAVLCVRP